MSDLWPGEDELPTQRMQLVVWEEPPESRQPPAAAFGPFEAVVVVLWAVLLGWLLLPYL